VHTATSFTHTDPVWYRSEVFVEHNDIQGAALEKSKKEGYSSIIKWHTTKFHCF
jgi:hypothetical protein